MNYTPYRYQNVARKEEPQIDTIPAPRLSSTPFKNSDTEIRTLERATSYQTLTPVAQRHRIEGSPISQAIYTGNKFNILNSELSNSILLTPQTQTDFIATQNFSAAKNQLVTAPVQLDRRYSHNVASPSRLSKNNSP